MWTIRIKNKIAKRTIAYVLVPLMLIGIIICPDLIVRADGGASITYDAYMQTYGWMGWVGEGKTSGKVGEGKRLEGVRLNFRTKRETGGLRYRTFVQTNGWMPWVSEGQFSGTRGEKKRIEALQIKLTGRLAAAYDIFYRVYIPGYGWLAWAKNGAIAGSQGLKMRIEAYQVVIMVKSDDSMPYGDGTDKSDVSRTAINPNAIEEMLYASKLTYSAYSTGNSWSTFVSVGNTAGTTGEDKQMEALRIKLASEVPGNGVEYHSYIKGRGWEEEWKANGDVSGTIGSDLPIEAVQIRLTGMIADYCDVYYRVYIKNQGWLDWAVNGGYAGELGLDSQIEAIEMCMLKKTMLPPGEMEKPFLFFVDYKSLAREKYPQACAVLDSVGWDLRSAFNWSVRMRYSWISTDPNMGLRYFADYGFTTGRGNCYAYAATFCEMALALGYDAHLVTGSVPLARGGLGPHGWVEIDGFNGGTYVFDPDFASEMGRNGFAINYGYPGTWIYYRERRID